ncbi:MAG: hypothetical protein Q8S33_21890 [Myxococcales bacterium]|nr:hypothetical protein [Myxococcales bacterium]MDP3503000.1 hypothetical protein [Myxococcales bacterium]
MKKLAVLVALSLSSLVFAQDAAPAEAESAELKAGKELLTKYLTSVKAKKWADAKKLLHPKTLDSIAERKKRMGKEDHPMAPWFHEKVDYYLKDFKVVGSRQGPTESTIIVDATEDNFQIEDKGVAEGEKAAYLLGKKDGKWFVVDKKRGEDFTNDSIKIGYKGWFDKIEKKEEPAAE